MHKKELIAYLAEELGYTKADVQRIFEQQNKILELNAELMETNNIDKVRLGDLIIEMKKRKARSCINPRTKKEQEIEEKSQIKVKYRKKKKYGSGKEE